MIRLATLIETPESEQLPLQQTRIYLPFLSGVIVYIYNMELFYEIFQKIWQYLTLGLLHLQEMNCSLSLQG